MLRAGGLGGRGLALDETPRLVVELDDRSHEKKDRQERDELVVGALKAAGLPILHVAAAKGYVPQE